MQDDMHYFENPNYRLIEYIQDREREIYLTMCGIEQCLPGKQVDCGERRGYHLHAVIHGKGTLWADGKEIHVHEGQLFLTTPAAHIEYQADLQSPWYYCWVTYDGSKARTFLERAGFTRDVYVLDCHIDIQRFLVISQEMLKKPKLNYSSELYRVGLALQFLSLAVESYEEQNGRAAYYNELSADDYIEYAIKYINNNFATVRIREVAEYVNLNRTYFTALFRRKMCMSPQDYLMKIRMERAVDLLRNTKLPIRMIASSVGYEDPLTFSKVFKQKYGIGPRNYRTGNQS